MPEAKLREALDELQSVLDRHAPLDAQDHDLLLEVQDKVERLLEQTQETQVAGAPEVHAEVGGLLGRFEADHPELAQILGAIAHTLSSLGI
ncbi:MAG: DUF4404 family protein [Deltaproteobacteria bacterium]|nr:MAG: DUF4404 family protein [Deltaproteobacteria bacterium]